MNQRSEKANSIYLDNSATTPISPRVAQKMCEVMQIYGNPSSLHSEGQKAEALIKQARATILSALGSRAREDRLIFTSCGTEATALALIGSANAKERRDATRVLISDSEHPSVSNCAAQLERQGFEIVKIPTCGGVLDMEALASSLDKKIFLASFMLVNNETGAVYSVGKAFEQIKAAYPEAICHCDAVQGFMKIPFTPASLRADLITISGHKLHAPKGVGALYVSGEMIKKKKIVTILPGGGQEGGMRSGTENTLGIVAFGEAVAEAVQLRANDAAHYRELYRVASEGFRRLGLTVNRPASDYAHHIINITLPDIKSETALHALSAKGIFVSSGSACSSHSHTPSRALLAFGLSPHEADCSLRISFSRYNTVEDVTALTNALKEAISSLVRIKRSVL